MASKPNKTQPTEASVQAYLDAIEDPARRADCQALAALMHKATQQSPQMWGSAIVGFGRYHYVYASGREGDACRVGFSSRKGDISLYVSAGFDGAAELLAQLGPHKAGKACLYIKRMADLNLPVLEQLITKGDEAMRRRYPG